MESLLQRYLYGWHGPLLVNQGFVAHVGWALALPLMGYWLGQRRGMLGVATAWIAYAFVREFVEEPLDATTFSDLVSRIAPVAILLAIEFFRRKDTPTPIAQLTE